MWAGLGRGLQDCIRVLAGLLHTNLQVIPGWEEIGAVDGRQFWETQGWTMRILSHFKHS